MTDEKKKELLLQLASSRYQYFYSNFAHNSCSFSPYLNNEFISMKDLRELPLDEILKCYLKIGSTEFYIFRLLDKTLQTLQSKFELNELPKKSVNNE